MPGPRRTRLLAPQTSWWKPSRLPGLKLWFDVEDGDLLNLPDSTVITNWGDKSGLGNTLTQGTPAAKPLYRTSQLAGHGILDFEIASTVDSMATAAPVSTVVDDWVMWIVARQVGGSANGSAFFGNGAGANGYMMISRHTSTPFQKGFGFVGVAAVQSGIAANTDWGLWVMARIAGTTRLWIDGGAPVGTSALAPATPTGSTGLVINYNGTFNPHQVALGGFHERRTTIDEVNRFGKYMMRKRGLLWTPATM